MSSPSKEVRRAYYQRNKEKILAATHDRYIQNKEYYLEYQREYRKKHREIISKKQNAKRKIKLNYLIDLLGDKCSICGHSFPDCVYDFHHINPEEKEFTISEFMGYSLHKLEKEAHKCILVCANCHRILHAS